MKISNIEIKGRASLAPMAGVTDRAFREICSLLGASYFTSEMVSVKGLIYKSEKTYHLTNHSDIERPFAIQLFGNCPEDFEKAIYLLNDQDAEMIDINMGCPAKKIVKEKSGSYLMKDPLLCGEIVDAAVRASKVPITVKIRAGWDENNKNAVDVATTCEQFGASAITVHGRTREQGYSGKCDLNIIKAVKESVKVPIIGNGDVDSLKSANYMLEFTGCDMVAVGRASMGNPWIFSEINKNVCKNISWKEKQKIMILHLEKICEYKGELVGVKEARKHMACYIRDFPDAAKVRARLFNCCTKKEMINILSECNQ